MNYWINRNMGCIEITFCSPFFWILYRLIETWDVLKFITAAKSVVILID